MRGNLKGHEQGHGACKKHSSWHFVSKTKLHSHIVVIKFLFNYFGIHSPHFNTSVRPTIDRLINEFDNRIKWKEGWDWRAWTRHNRSWGRGGDEEKGWGSSHLSFWQMTLKLALGPHCIFFCSNFSPLLPCCPHSPPSLISHFWVSLFSSLFLVFPSFIWNFLRLLIFFSHPFCIFSFCRRLLFSPKQQSLYDASLYENKDI